MPGHCLLVHCFSNYTLYEWVSSCESTCAHLPMPLLSFFIHFFHLPSRFSISLISCPRFSVSHPQKNAFVFANNKSNMAKQFLIGPPIPRRARCGAGVHIFHCVFSFDSSIVPFLLDSVTPIGGANVTVVYNHHFSLHRLVLTICNCPSIVPIFPLLLVNPFHLTRT